MSPEDKKKRRKELTMILAAIGFFICCSYISISHFVQMWRMAKGY